MTHCLLLLIKKSAGGVLFDEFVIYDPRQAYLRYVINYKVTEIGVPAGSVISTKFQKYEILRSRSFDTSNELDYHFRLAEAEFQRFCKNRDVVKVTYVINPALESQFLETSKNLLQNTELLQKKPSQYLHFMVLQLKEILSQSSRIIFNALALSEQLMAMDIIFQSSLKRL
ncbi:hypothetical protein QYM36_017153 [Artemia franciscana]|uniref:PARP catalytic domain-containing protein n=1 Tax=Artemia franciscana TaxID=6661 RepID=A0AA88HA38_ARTSF|nr:hypothetical protein QYM36_017153 [Artemia franciscana]